jgi:hypothetical protein
MDSSLEIWERFWSGNLNQELIHKFICYWYVFFGMKTKLKENRKAPLNFKNNGYK